MFVVDTFDLAFQHIEFIIVFPRASELGHLLIGKKAADGPRRVSIEEQVIELMNQKCPALNDADAAIVGCGGGFLVSKVGPHKLVESLILKDRVRMSRISSAMAASEALREQLTAHAEELVTSPAMAKNASSNQEESN